MADVPGGEVDRNPPAGAGDMGWVPGPWTFHMSQSNKGPCTSNMETVHHSYWSLSSLGPASRNYWARMLQLLKPVGLEPVLRNRRSHCSEKPTPTVRSNPHSWLLDKAYTQQRRFNATEKWMNKQIVKKTKTMAFFTELEQIICNVYGNTKGAK